MVAGRSMSALAYILFSLGIFARQLIPFPKVVMETANLRWSTLAASLVLGLALFPTCHQMAQSQAPAAIV
jgi:hypothetical protein